MKIFFKNGKETLQTSKIIKEAISNEPLGTLLLKYIEADFTTLEGFKKFENEFGSNEFRSFIENPEELSDCEKQFAINRLIFHCLDYDRPEWSEKYTPSQRYFYMIHSPAAINPIEKGMFSEFTIEYFPVHINKDYDTTTPDNEVEIVHMYKSDDIHTICFIEFMEIVKNNIFIRKCKYDKCNRYFLFTDKRTEFCDRIAEGETKKCNVIGPIKNYQSKLEEDQHLKAYQLAYKSKHAQLRKSKKTNSDRLYKEKELALKEWRVRAREKAEIKDLPLELYKEWLKK